MHLIASPVLAFMYKNQCYYIPCRFTARKNYKDIFSFLYSDGVILVCFLNILQK